MSRSKSTLSSPPMPSPQAPTCSAGRILAAAQQLFAELGYDAVSTSAIAEQAGVSKANIFHHFSSKKALYLAVLTAGCKKSTPLLDDMIQESGSLSERLCHFIRAHIDNLHKYDEVSRLLLRELLENEPQRGQEIAEQVLGENFSRLVGILRDSQRCGELRRNVDPAMVAMLLVGANVFFFQSREVLRHFPDIRFADDLAAYSRRLTEILVNGVAMPALKLKTNTPDTHSTNKGATRKKVGV
ncbi:MAG: TetR/AcrR family transcriptional regulator [Gammaproteobacteria bacterium]